MPVLNFKERESIIWFMMRRGRWSSFGDPRCAITPGILKIVADIADKSIMTYKERKDASRKYFITLTKAQIRDGHNVSKSVIQEMEKMEAEIKAESEGEAKPRLRG